jgi:hypothetical protein
MKNNSVMIDVRMKSKIESLTEWGKVCSVKFNDIHDTFWFSDKNMLQEFLHNQAAERFYDKELRKGYFDYINEHSETLRYHVESNRGTLTLLKEECIY